LKDEIIVLGTVAGMVAAATGADRSPIDEQLEKALVLVKKLEAAL
jgi:hypothetical protein